MKSLLSVLRGTPMHAGTVELGSKDGGERPSENKPDLKVGLGPTPSFRIKAPPPQGADFLDAELPDITRRLARGERFSDGELASLRGHVLRLNGQQMQQMAKILRGALSKKQLSALRKKSRALSGPADADKLMQMIGGPGRLGRLPLSLKESMRVAREQSLRSLIDRAALKVVNGNEGLFKRLNPGSAEHPEGVPFIASDGSRKDSIDQRYELLEMVGRMFQVGLREEEIRKVADMVSESGDPSAQAVKGRFETVMRNGMAEVHRRESRFAEFTPRFPASQAQLKSLALRLSQVRFLEIAGSDLMHPKEKAAFLQSYTSDLERLFRSRSYEAASETLDGRTEHMMDLLVAKRHRGHAIPQIDTIKYDRIHSQRGPGIDVVHQTQSLDHPVQKALDELRGRLDRGELPAVGVEYATNTFPSEILDRAADGQLTVVAYNGSVENGIDYIRARYGTDDDGMMLGARTLGLQGLYGSYPRQLVTLADGQQFLLLAGYGESRQLNNMGTVVLYEDAKGQRIPPSQVVLATDHTDMVEAFRADIARVVEASGGNDPTVSNRMMILQNPKHLGHLLGEQIEWKDVPEDTMVPMFVGIRTHDDGSRERVIVPKVGGGGVYGDTAGDFLRAYFSSDLAKASKDVIFNGTAGGFAGTEGSAGFEGERRAGLPDVEPGGIFMPLHGVGEHGDDELLPIPGFVPNDPARWPDDLKAAAKQAGLHFTGRHVAVKAPAIETHPLIRELVAQGYASIDVEAASMMRAARDMGVRVNVVYTHSDDPRSSEQHPNTSLGQVGPFLEGSRYHQKLFDFISRLWDHSRAQAAGTSSASRA